MVVIEIDDHPHLLIFGENRSAVEPVCLPGVQYVLGIIECEDGEFGFWSVVILGNFEIGDVVVYHGIVEPATILQSAKALFVEHYFIQAHYLRILVRLDILGRGFDLTICLRVSETSMLRNPFFNRDPDQISLRVVKISLLNLLYLLFIFTNFFLILFRNLIGFHFENLN